MKWTTIVAAALVLALESRPSVIAVDDLARDVLSGQVPGAVARQGFASSLPRTVLALYDSSVAADITRTDIHRLVEMPLNYLGVIVRYHDLRQGLPAVSELTDVRGVLTWFSSNAMERPEDYLRWGAAVMDSGRRFVVLGSVGALQRPDGEAASSTALEPFLARLGLERSKGWTTTTYGLRYMLRDRAMVEFERPLPSVIPPFDRYRALADATSFLSVSGASPDTRGDLVVVSSRGGYVAPGYAIFSHHYRNRTFMQWYLNPFEFFRLALATDELPKPDPSTLSGRRVFYSHIDGDGWRNLSLIEPYRTRFSIAARVVLEEVLKTYRDFPVTVGPVAADVDPRWHGTRESIDVAREALALSHVEASVHTYSHPLDWQFFRDAGPGDEARYRLANVDELSASDGAMATAGEYAAPRSYNKQPFDLQHETAGAAAFVESLLPAGKRVNIIQWSGSTAMYEEALAEARRAGLVNINGGDTRFDREYPSHAWVAPLSRQVGRERQIYSSNSNENTYTDLWRDRFFGFRFLVNTIRNTGVPRRLKPFNLYYHMYSGERLSSLNAVRMNLDYARTQELAPVTTSRYAASVEGFFSTRIQTLGRRHWRISNRQTLQSLRFDAASQLAVDFARSVGVVGQRHTQGSLHVALDERVAAAEIALLEMSSPTEIPTSPRPYLVEGRWRVWDVRSSTSSAEFETQGFGSGTMSWRWPTPAIVEVEWSRSGRTLGRMASRTDDQGIVRVALPDLAQEGLHVKLRTESRGDVEP